MAVEIVILSGARQGERLLLEAGEFRAGDQPGCEVFFNPESDPGAKNRSARFRLADDGWYVERTGGGELFVNQDLVARRSRIRSGDLVRLSDRGPDFSFAIVTRGTASPPSAASQGAAPVVVPAATEATTSEAEAHSAPPPIPREPEPSLEPAPEPKAAPQPSPAHEPVSEAYPAAAPKPVAAAEPWRHAFWAVVVLAVCILIFVCVWPVIFGTLIQGNDPVATSAESEPAAPEAKESAAPSGPTGVQAEQPDAPPEEKPKPPLPEDPWATVSERLRDAVFLIQVEVKSPSGSHFLAHGTCSAISEDTLLISGREANILANWREQDGWTIWATDPERGIKEEVQDIRIHRALAESGHKPDRWIFANFGLLTVQGKLPNTASLASPDALGALEEGLPLALFGFSFEEAEKITRFDIFKPELVPGKVYLMAPPDDPELLHMKAEIPGHVYGSPIVNQQGEIVAVYGEAVPPESTPVKDLHYVTVINPQSIEAWLQKRDTELWVEPVILEKTPSNP